MSSKYDPHKRREQYLKRMQRDGDAVRQKSRERYLAKRAQQKAADSSSAYGQITASMCNDALTRCIRPRMLTPKEAADLLGITVIELIMAGIEGTAPRPYGFNEQGESLYPYADIESYLEKTEHGKNTSASYAVGVRVGVAPEESL